MAYSRSTGQVGWVHSNNGYCACGGPAAGGLDRGLSRRAWQARSDRRNEQPGEASEFDIYLILFDIKTDTASQRDPSKQEC